MEKDEVCRKAALDTAEKVMRYALEITEETANPFGYARIFYQDKDGKRGTQFFFPHNKFWQKKSLFKDASLLALPVLIQRM